MVSGQRLYPLNKDGDTPLVCFCTGTNGSGLSVAGAVQFNQMKFAACIALVCAGLPLGASTVDVSNLTTVLVQGGDTLTYDLITWNFGANALALGLPQYPTGVDFTLLSAPFGLPVQFAATLASAGGSVTVGFGGPLWFHAGTLSSAGYQGAVSVLEGHLALSPALSQDLFGSGGAQLRFANAGGDVTLGLDPYVLRQDLFVSLSGGPLSVGALPAAVTLQSAPQPFAFSELESFAAPIVETPEPGPGWLVLAGVALLYGFSAARRRLASRTH